MKLLGPNISLMSLLTRTYTRLYLIALLFYYAFWAMTSYITWPDSLAYLEMGRGIFEHFTFGYRGLDGSYYANSFRVPVVPFVMGFIYFVVRDSGATYSILTLSQVFLAPVLPCAAFYFGSQLSRATGWGAYFFTLFNANVLISTVSVLTDTYFAASAVATFTLLWMSLHTDRSRPVLLAGLFAGLSCLVRPIMKLYFLVVALMALAFANQWKPLSRLFAIYALSFFIVVSPWLIRNYLHYGAPVFETNQGLNLLWTNWSLVRIKKNDPPETRRIKAIIMCWRESPMEMVHFNGGQYWIENDYAVSKQLESIAKEAYVEHPIAVFLNWRVNFLNMALSTESYQFMIPTVVARPSYQCLRSAGIFTPETFDRRFRHLVWETERLMKWGYLYISPLGLILLLWKKRRLGIFFGVHIFYFTGLTAFVAGYDRYRLCLEVFYAVLIICPFIFAAGFIKDKITRYRRSRGAVHGT